MADRKQAEKPQGHPDKAHEGKELRHLVRVLNTDLKGEKQVLYALTKIKGVDIMFANAVLKKSGVPADLKAGYMDASQVSAIEGVLQRPLHHGIPNWLLNRRKDVETGEDKHLFTAGIDFTHEMDLKKLKKTKSYKGFRHQWGQPVRGQRTKANTRKNKGKGSLGVQKKKVGKKAGK